jgi:hypothetical protein
MCFSATASFVAGGSLSATGGFMLTRATTRAALPLAAIPLLFGIQQLTEGVVWVSFDVQPLSDAATFVYSMFSHVLWPILVPLAVLLLESDPVRKRMLRALVAVGVAVGMYLLFFVLRDGIVARVEGSSVVYDSPHLYLPLVVTLYVSATCVSSLVSSHALIRLLGAVMFTSFLVAGIAFSEAFISVWCFFAALLSGVIYLFLRSGQSAVTKEGSRELSVLGGPV